MWAVSLPCGSRQSKAIHIAIGHRLKEALNKYLHRHAGDRFVRNESGRTKCARRVQTKDGLQQYQHPVDNCFYWILAGADSLSSAWASCVALSPASMPSSRDIF